VGRSVEGSVPVSASIAATRAFWISAGVSGGLDGVVIVWRFGLDAVVIWRCGVALDSTSFVTLCSGAFSFSFSFGVTLVVVVVVVVVFPSLGGEVTTDRFDASSTGGCTEDFFRGIFNGSSGGGKEDFLRGILNGSSGGGTEDFLRGILNGSSAAGCTLNFLRGIFTGSSAGG